MSISQVYPIIYSLDVLDPIHEHWGHFRDFCKLDDPEHKYETDKASGQGEYLRKYEMFLGCWKHKTFNMPELV